jgi:Icc-related predicted phosphoesterase
MTSDLANVQRSNHDHPVRLHILSDLHLEFGPFQPPATRADVVVLAGDVHTGKNGLRWIAETFRDRPVIYVLGNHEFYGHDTPKLTEELRQLTAGSNIYVLENDCVEIGGVVFLGATLWTDFKLNGDPILAVSLAATGMNDFNRIRVSQSYRRFRPSDARQLYAESVRWLEAELSRAEGKTRVVVTHHAPSQRSIGPLYTADPLNPAFASDLEHLIQASGAALWVHGHIHYTSDYVLGQTRIVNNPRGYPGESVAGFAPALVVGV